MRCVKMNATRGNSMEWVLLINVLSSRMFSSAAVMQTIPMHSREVCLKAIDNFKTRNPESNVGFTCVSSMTGEVVGPPGHN